MPKSRDQVLPASPRHSRQGVLQHPLGHPRYRGWSTQAPTASGEMGRASVAEAQPHTLCTVLSLTTCLVPTFQ